MLNLFVEFFSLTQSHGTTNNLLLHLLCCNLVPKLSLSPLPPWTTREAGEREPGNEAFGSVVQINDAWPMGNFFLWCAFGSLSLLKWQDRYRGHVHTTTPLEFENAGFKWFSSTLRSNLSCYYSVFEKLRFRDGLMWKTKIKLCFQIPPVYCGLCG